MVIALNPFPRGVHEIIWGTGLYFPLTSVCSQRLHRSSLIDCDAMNTSDHSTLFSQVIKFSLFNGVDKLVLTQFIPETVLWICIFSFAHLITKVRVFMLIVDKQNQQSVVMQLEITE